MLEISRKIILRVIPALVSVLFLFSPSPSGSAEPVYDVLIKGGKIFDGTLRPPFTADIAVTDDRIAAIGKIKGKAKKIIQAKGLIVVPGFIDIHEHSDGIFGEDFPKMAPEIQEEYKINANAVFQGVTTVVTGNCGQSPFDTRKWLATVDEMHFGTNVAHLVPHGKIRSDLFGSNQPEKLAPDQLDRMKARVKEGMGNGAYGLSSGLAYAPGRISSPEEMIELCKIVRQYGGIYATHMRDESGAIREDGKVTLLESIREAVEVARKSGVSLQISHLKLQAPHTITGADILSVIESARSEGLNVTADSYPYTSGYSEMIIILPNRFKSPSGGIHPKYRNAEGREEIRKYIEQIFEDIPPEKIIIMSHPANKKYQGKTLKEIAWMEGKAPGECYVEQAMLDPVPTAVVFAHNEQAMIDFMPNHYVFTCSDGMAWSRKMEGAHPRFYGAFSTKLKTYAINRKIMSLQDAIRSMTYLPAEKLGLDDRGRLSEGAFADIAVINLKTLKTNATYRDPARHSGGVYYLLVNGVMTIEKGKLTGNRGGRALRKN